MMILTLGERMLVYRKRTKMTKKQLADLCGVKTSDITKFENDEVFPDDDTLDKIADAFGVLDADVMIYGF